jgi:hypothetical protein
VLGQNDIQVSLQDLPAGVYNCQLTTASKVVNKKLTIVK